MTVFTQLPYTHTHTLHISMVADMERRISCAVVKSITAEVSWERDSELRWRQRFKSDIYSPSEIISNLKSYPSTSFRGGQKCNKPQWKKICVCVPLTEFIFFIKQKLRCREGIHAWQMECDRGQTRQSGPLPWQCNLRLWVCEKDSERLDDMLQKSQPCQYWDGSARHPQTKIRKCTIYADSVYQPFKQQNWLWH